MGLCLGVASILNIYMMGKKLKNNFFNYKYLILSIICALPTALISKWMFSLICNIVPLFFSLAISSVVGFIFYILFAIVFDLCDFSFLKLNKKSSHTLNIKNGDKKAV